MGAPEVEAEAGDGEGTGWADAITGLSEAQPAASFCAGGAGETEGDPRSGVGSEEEEGLERGNAFLLGELHKVGEVLVEVGSTSSSTHGWGPNAIETEEELESCIERLRSVALERGKADISVLRRRTITEDSGAKRKLHLADVEVRRRAGNPLEVRIAVVGNVDSGKSTMVGVLTRSMLDDGRGSARQKILKFSHEAQTGRTSSIGQHNLCISSTGEILNDSTFRQTQCGEVVARSSKLITMVDLAGHEKYFKTTAFGLTGNLPDYAMLIIGANHGLIGMCKEHLGIALALKIPSFFVITKIDICPEHIFNNTMKSLHAVLKKPGVRKIPIMVRTQDDVMTCARNIASDTIAPIFLTSSVTGEGLDLLRQFMNLIPQRYEWFGKMSLDPEFIIDETFAVPGVGTVVAGTVKSGVIGVNSTLLLGPDIADSSFKPIAIKSIHYKRMVVDKVVAGQTAALALKRVKRNQVRKGMALVASSFQPEASWEFDADIAILTHSTTIHLKYQAVIHCEIIRQAAKVVAMDCEKLRSGDRAIVRFRFLVRPEYVCRGTRFVFREGKTKGIGLVV
uniref:Tr-type G domain-containing protein n=1 Tax=Chloropicon roscoffensis TaxID=1461544 RepID=A0A7S3CBQ2_9CHLO|mmetsp:Transcript_4510/g.13656  ORF Transcript_4510/g.13656 Transcript_4510/m.13656 type:complete len:566 (+) Transcript_4510:15-1712(+)